MHCVVWDKAPDGPGDNSCQHCEDGAELAGSRIHILPHEVPEQEQHRYPRLGVRALHFLIRLRSSQHWHWLISSVLVFPVLQPATLLSNCWVQGWKDWAYDSAKSSTRTSITVRPKSNLTGLFSETNQLLLINLFRSLDARCRCQCFLH